MGGHWLSGRQETWQPDGQEIGSCPDIDDDKEEEKEEDKERDSDVIQIYQPPTEALGTKTRPLAEQKHDSQHGFLQSQGNACNAAAACSAAWAHSSPFHRQSQASMKCIVAGFTKAALLRCVTVA